MLSEDLTSPAPESTFSKDFCTSSLACCTPGVNGMVNRFLVASAKMGAMALPELAYLASAIADLRTGM